MINQDDLQRRRFNLPTPTLKDYDNIHGLKYLPQVDKRYLIATGLRGPDPVKPPNVGNVFSRAKKASAGVQHPLGSGVQQTPVQPVVPTAAGSAVQGPAQTGFPGWLNSPRGQKRGRGRGRGLGVFRGQSGLRGSGFRGGVQRGVSRTVAHQRYLQHFLICFFALLDRAPNFLL